MASWLCKIAPWLCHGRGILGSSGGTRKNPRWRWVRWWAEVLNEAEAEPTLEELEVLAYACLKSGYPKDAAELVMSILRPAETQSWELDAFTKAHLCMIGARALSTIGQAQQGSELLSEMPGREELLEALGQLQELPVDAQDG